MNVIPKYPVFVPISASMYNELYPFLNNLPDGISEFTFLNLYLHRAKYDYQICKLKENCFAVKGREDERNFFYIMGELHDTEMIFNLLNTYGRWKNMSERHYAEYSDLLFNLGYKINEDRDNEDYLYLKEKLASLAGKSLHKKRNLANGFENSYSWEIKKLESKNAHHAGEVLDLWIKNKEEGFFADYEQCVQALELLPVTNQEGIIVYVEGQPAGWALGEYIARGKMFLVYFEKAIDGFRGVYQFLNRATARYLPDTVEFINREQDLGDEGLRQAKMTYRPAGFVKKYFVEK